MNETDKKQLDAFVVKMLKRRSVRHFSTQQAPESVILECIKVAATAPSGANQQPWHFVMITDAEKKRFVRQESEKIEYEFYHRTAPQEWLKALAPLGTNHEKPFLEDAPCLIVVFMIKYTINPDGTKSKHYYPLESVGIATGFLLAALRMAGLSSLVYTPPKRDFLNKLLNRPKNEKAFAVIVTGYPANENQLHLNKKNMAEILTAF